MIIYGATCCPGGQSCIDTVYVCELIQNITSTNMNYIEFIRIYISEDELIPIYTNLYNITRSDVLLRGAVLPLQPGRVCVCVNLYEM